MRTRDPRDDPPVREREPYRGPPLTLGHTRAHGCRRLVIYCSAGPFRHYGATIEADRWPDDTVLLDLDRRAAII